MAANGLPEEDGGDFPRNNNASSDDEQHPESQLSMDPNLNNATNSPIMNNQEMDAENSSPTAETDDLSEEHPEVDSSDDDAENMGINANRQDEDKKLDRIADFTVGLQLDVLDSVGKWAEAEVLKVDQMRRQVYITYLYWADKWNEWVPIDSDRIAPLASQTYVEGKELQMGMRVEALDERHHWLEAEVVDIRVDQAKIHYRGWKDTYDEWVPRCPGVNNNKIRPFGRNKAVAKKKRTFRYTVGLGPRANSAHIRAIQASTTEFGRYEAELNRHGLRLHAVEGDGNCLFRSVSHQVYGDDRHHVLVREKCMDYMMEEADYFEPYVEGGMDEYLRYIEIKRRNGIWGDDPEVQAMCELYDRPAEIWAYDPNNGARKLRTFHETRADQQQRPPMRLSYYGGGHYDSIQAADHSQTIISDRLPGETEDEAIIRSRRRNTIGGYEEAKQRSDEEATERTAMNLALQASREEFEAQNEDVENALIASLNHLAMESGGMIDPSDLENAQNDNAVKQVQSDILKTVMERSEEEELRKAMAMSLEQHATEDMILNDVIKSSLSEEEQLVKQALMASMAGIQDYPQDEDPELAAAISASMKDSGQDHIFAGAMDEMNEEELLKIALEESMYRN
mmetsp:Transcript_8068/g.10706  ORF Transcript_8068/g.10706 Transcript_8068/m.10706 type:complete len:624 (+) Transcript_8068:104-1975(+)